MDTVDVESGDGEDNAQPGENVSATVFGKLLRQIRAVVRFKNGISPAVKEDNKRRDLFLDRYTSKVNTGTINIAGKRRASRSGHGSHCARAAFSFYIIPDGEPYFYWMTVLCCAVLYNFWLIMPRIAFRGLQDRNSSLFFVFDYLCDGIYILDIFFRFHLGYFEEGVVVHKAEKMKKEYVGSIGIWFDIIALLPLDLVYLLVGIEPLLRLPRLIKGFRLLPFTRMIETRLHYIFISRIAVLVHLLALCIHWDACFFFLVSRAEGLASDGWVYRPENINGSSVLLAYLFSFHWATLALTTIGDLPVPHTVGEFLFTIINYMLGVLIFATLVGQLGQIISNVNESQSDFEKLMDNTKNYLRKCEVPKSLQQRVSRWYDYSRKKGRLAGRGRGTALRYLPDKLKAEVALYANVATLQKVDLFKDIPPGLLHELVLKMKSVLFTPGDTVCRRGDIGREMFIVRDGKLAVTTDYGDLIIMLSEGDYFGEISLLAVNDSNRRTANVFSVGYSELLILTKHDLEEPFLDHPEFKAALIERATIRLNQALSKQEQAAESDAEPEQQHENWTSHMVVPPTPPIPISILGDGAGSGAFCWRRRRREGIGISLSGSHDNVSNLGIDHEPRAGDGTTLEDTLLSRCGSASDGISTKCPLEKRGSFLSAQRKLPSRRGTEASIFEMGYIPGSHHEFEIDDLRERLYKLENKSKDQQSRLNTLESESDKLHGHSIPAVSVSRPISPNLQCDLYSHSNSSRSESSIKRSGTGTKRGPPKYASVNTTVVMVNHAGQLSTTNKDL